MISAFNLPRLSGSGFRVQRSGFEKPRQLVSKGSCLHLVVNPFYPMGDVGIPDLK
jgi:hypothetical protein